MQSFMYLKGIIPSAGKYLSIAAATLIWSGGIQQILGELPLLIDFGQSQESGAKESGFQLFGVSNLGTKGPVSTTYGDLVVRVAAGATVDADGILNGSEALLARKRAPLEGGPLGEMLRDWIGTVEKPVLGIQVSGLRPNASYTVTFYSYDHNTTGQAAFTDITGATPSVPNGVNLPLGSIVWKKSSFGNETAKKELALSATVKSDGAGRVTFRQDGTPICGLELDEAERATLPASPATVGGGTVEDPATGPAPAFGIGGTGFSLVKNWDFGSNGTIQNMTELSSAFQYHDYYEKLDNGGNYGAKMVAPNAETAIPGQPVEGPGVPPVREFTEDSLKTFVVPLGGTTLLDPHLHNAGCGSFQAKWALPGGGAGLGQDIVWETRVRYVPPKYFWFALWVYGPEWHKVEIDVVESFGYDNGKGPQSTNFDGRYWHSQVALGKVPEDNSKKVNYAHWGNGMASVGIPTYDASQYHIWTMLYRADNSVELYVDGTKVQWGSLNWTYGGGATAKQMPAMYFLFDAGWGHTLVTNNNREMDVSELAGKFYEFDYSRVYLRPSKQSAP